MSPAGLRSLRLTRFKSHRDQVIELQPVTLLIGRNGSGKSNVLDALSLLALLADERDVSDLERGDQEVAGLRGGLSGAAPFGGNRVELGCMVERSNGELLEFNVEFDTSDRPEIIRETLVLHNSRGRRIELIDAVRRERGAGISDVKTYSGANPRYYNLLTSRLAIVQAATKIPSDTAARRLIGACCQEVAATLRGIFVLDPVPANMRTYVRIGSPPDRSGSTTSALAYEMRNDPAAWSRMHDLVSALVESRLDEITFLEGGLPGQPLADVMLALNERAGKRSYTASARVMSDGTLRYLSIVASMLALSSAHQLDPLGPPVQRTLLVEEVENGLFPSQGEKVMDLLRHEAQAQGIRLIATTHSPALLDALQPEDHRGVVICSRMQNGWSQLIPLVRHSRYVEIAGDGAVGLAVTRGMLEVADHSGSRSISEILS